MSPLPQVKKEICLPPADTYGSCQGDPPSWPFSAIQLDSDIFWFKDRPKQSSHWADESGMDGVVV